MHDTSRPRPTRRTAPGTRAGSAAAARTAARTADGTDGSGHEVDTHDAVAPGRRERKKQDTRRRILEAATQLFTLKGYSAVTTQEIADLADVGAGTLFRYAPNKAELLMMVMNERVTTTAPAGDAPSDPGPGTVDAVLQLVAPLFAAAAAQPENMSAYQREVLFGAPGPARAEALERIRGLEHALGEVLAAHVRRHGARPGADPARAATALFSVLYLKLVRLELGSVGPASVDALLRDDVTTLVADLLGP